MTQPQRTRPPQQQTHPARRDPAVGPVEAAGIAFVYSLIAIYLFRITHVPPWVILPIHLGIAAALAWAGRKRRPRPLSRQSVAFQVTATTICGQWIFWNVADPGAGAAAVGAVVGQAIIAAVLVGAVLAGLRFGGWKWMLLAGAGALIVGEAVLYGLVGSFTGGVAGWVQHVLTTPEPAPRGLAYVRFLWPYRLLFSGALAAVAAIIGWRLAGHEAELDEKKWSLLSVRPMAQKQQAMQMLLPQVMQEAKNAVVTHVDEWKNGAGETYTIDHSFTNIAGYEDFNQYCKTLAARMTLKKGCVVESGEGAQQGQSKLYVTRVNKLAELHRYPIELRRRSIYDTLPAGVLRPGDVAGYCLREDKMVVIGQQGSGKTLFEQCTALNLAQCVDTLIWVIDYNKGKLALPLVRAWAEGKAVRPVIDWVAPDVDEALIMVRVAEKIALDRNHHYAWLKWEKNTNLLPMSASLPQIVILLDEGAEIMGEAVSGKEREVAETLERIHRMNREAGITVVFSVLEATQNMLPRPVKAGCSIRVGLRVTEKTHLAYLFDEYQLDPKACVEQGSGYILTGHGAEIRNFKGYFLEPKDMYEISILLGVPGWRPYLDRRGREIGAVEYADRWRRNGRFLHRCCAPNRLGIDLDDDPDAGAPEPLHGFFGGTPINTEAAETAPAGAATATAVMDRPSSPPPGGDGPDRPGRREFDEKTARQPIDTGGGDFDSTAAAEATLARLEGLGPQPDSPPVDDTRVPVPAGPAGGGPPPGDDKPAAGPGVPGDPQFEQIVSGEQDWGKWADADLPPTGAPAPQSAHPATQPVRPPTNPEILERLILMEGPIRYTDLVKKLAVGGAWGRPVSVTVPTLYAWLRSATYLVERTDGEPYNHVLNVQRHG